MQKNQSQDNFNNQNLSPEENNLVNDPMLQEQEAKGIINDVEKSNKKYSIIVVLLILVGFGIWFFINSKKDVVDISESENEVVPEEVVETTKDEIVNKVNDNSDIWNLVDMQITYVQNGDLDGLKSITGRELLFECEVNKSDSCKEEVKSIKFMFEDLMDREFFVNRLENDKQVIVSTDPQVEVEGESNIYTKQTIYFTINEQDQLKFVMVSDSFNIIPISENVSVEELYADSDQDGLTDGAETCDEGSEIGTETCPTDKNNRDTDGDGYWDGVDQFLDN